MLLVVSPTTQAQTFVKSNIIDDALLNLNLGLEKQIAPKLSMELVGSFNAWTLSQGKRWKHWYAQPGVRYWFCDVQDGQFLGAHVHGGQYNIGSISGLSDFLGTKFSTLADHRYQGWFVGAGVSYGYSWMLGKHWNLEAEAGLGWAYTRYSKYRCASCGTAEEKNKSHNYVGPTKAAVNIVYNF